jgi:hypothetical protein
MAEPGPAQPATPDELAAFYLRARDVPCPGCNYNRRDGTAAECPECQTLIRLADNCADNWLSLSKRRSIFVGWIMLALCIAYWVGHCVSVWEVTQIISVDIRPWTQWWWILHLVVWIPAVICLPLAAWYFVRMLRQSPGGDADGVNRRSDSFYKGFRWGIIAIGPSSIFSIGLTIWELLP